MKRHAPRAINDSCASSSVSCCDNSRDAARSRSTIVTCARSSRSGSYIRQVCGSCSRQVPQSSAFNCSPMVHILEVVSSRRNDLQMVSALALIVLNLPDDSSPRRRREEAGRGPSSRARVSPRDEDARVTLNTSSRRKTRFFSMRGNRSIRRS